MEDNSKPIPCTKDEFFNEVMKNNFLTFFMYGASMLKVGNGEITNVEPFSEEWNKVLSEPHDAVVLDLLKS